MLNCTDLECILHHHHYYAHLHHLKHGTHEDDAMSGDTANLNDTGSELSGFSHLDAPSESLYMIGGVCVAMFMVGVIIVLLAVTISKLRKREEQERPDAARSGVVLETTPAPELRVHQLQPRELQVQQQRELQLHQELTYRGQFLWTQPPPPSSQQYLYNNNQELVQNLPSSSASGFARGFRKNLGGKWRRLVRRGGRKPAQEAAYAIPAELKPQLKQIYVY